VGEIGKSTSIPSSQKQKSCRIFFFKILFARERREIKKELTSRESNWQREKQTPR